MTVDGLWKVFISLGKLTSREQISSIKKIFYLNLRLFCFHCYRNVDVNLMFLTF
jgi:hypothetical protein